MAIPDNTTFTMIDVTLEIYDDINSGRNLDDCFIDAHSSWFNPLYSGNKDQLLNFRDYKNPNIAPHYIGEQYDDGILWYISADGKSGILCYYEENPSNIWSDTYELVDVTHQEFYWGAINTKAIAGFYPYDTFAAHDCLNIGSEWFLPTLEEMDRLLRVAWYGNYHYLNFLKHPFYHNDKYPLCFWTSSENSVSAAWIVYIENDEVNFDAARKKATAFYEAPLSIACKYVTF